MADTETSDRILPAGTPAPDFTLNATPDQTLELHELRGQPVVLVFYPADLGDRLYRQIVEQLGLPADGFERALTDSSGPILQRIEADFEGGIRSGANGTPAFFVNGERYDGGAENLVREVARVLETRR